MLGISIVVTSGKGGTGKTTCTAAIAQALAGLGSRVLAIDCDIGLKNLDLAMGLTDDAVWDFSDVISGRVEAQSAIIPHPDIENLFFLSAPSDMFSDDVDPALFSSLIKSAKSDFDYILMDSPAGLGSGFRLAASSADMAIIVSTWDAASLRDGQKAVGILRRMGVGDVKLIVNRVNPQAFAKTHATVDDIIDVVGAQLIGVVGEDEAVSLAANLEKPLMLFGDRRLCGQFTRIARRVAGERVPLGRI